MRKALNPLFNQFVCGLLSMSLPLFISTAHASWAESLERLNFRAVDATVALFQQPGTGLLTIGGFWRPELERSFIDTQLSLGARVGAFLLSNHVGKPSITPLVAFTPRFNIVGWDSSFEIITGAGFALVIDEPLIELGATFRKELDWKLLELKGIGVQYSHFFARIETHMLAVNFHWNW